MEEKYRIGNLEENTEEQSHGLTIPNELIERKDLKPIELLIWAHIDNFTRWAKGKACWETNEQIAEKWRIPAQKVSDIISHLKKLKLVEQVAFDGRRRVLKSCRGEVFKDS